MVSENEKQIYLDYNASTPIDPQVSAVMQNMMHDTFGNRVMLNGHPSERLPNTLNVSFVGEIGAEIIAAMPEVAASTGSACHTGLVELSPVLKAMGVSQDMGAGAIRFSLGRTTTAKEIDAVVEKVVRILARTE